MNDTLHIVCLDAPAPPDYGGAIDMFYKIKALHGIGKRLILHYFDYHPLRHADTLRSYCAAIYTYKRKPIWQAPPLSCPFIIQSRINKELIDRLNKDNLPILLEGLHCSGIIPFLNDVKRVVIRMHNEEAAYYRHLAKNENSFLKRSYFIRESRLLEQYQQNMAKGIPLACLSETDIENLKEQYGFRRPHFVPCFLPWQKISSLEGKGDYCLYHGNLSVSENEEAAIWLIQQVFIQTDVPLVIAGRGISKHLFAAAGKHANIRLINNPSLADIDRLVQQAHIHVLPSMNNTGVKLKLFNALLNGRFCLTNKNGIKGSCIQQGVVVQEEAQSWVNAIKELLQKKFNTNDRNEREMVLQLYNNQENAATLSALWTHYQ